MNSGFTKIIIQTVLCLTVCTVTSCSKQYATNSKMQYMESRNGPALSVPPPLTTRNISSFYDLPDQTQNAQVSLVPPV